MMDDRERIGLALDRLWIESVSLGVESEFMDELVYTLVQFALSIGVEGMDDYADDDTDAIEETIIKKVHNLLLTEIAKVNGT